jgi:HlyD family secretion protein
MKLPALPFLAILALAACNEDGHPVQGYVEADFLRIGLPSAGRVVSVAVERGAEVKAGQTLFALDDQAEQAAVAEAQAQLAQARFQHDNLLTGKRRREIEAITAQKAQAEADLKLALVQLTRQETLVRSDVASHADLDNARAAVERDQARLAELTANLGFAQEGGRDAEINAAASGVDAAAAALAQAEWRLAQRHAEAPKDARVEDVLFRPGEEVAAGQPVVSLLPPDNLLIRLFLGPSQIGKVASGAVLKVACEGCANDLTATVSFVAHEASYAPPVLYSRDNKDKLVFLVEARPSQTTAQLRPGQPVTVSLPP